MASEKTKFNTLRVTGDVLSPGKVLDPSAANSAGVRVGKGKLLRIRVAATAYIKFAAAYGVPSSSTDNTLELFTAGTYLVVSTDEVLSSSAAIARLEVL